MMLSRRSGALNQDLVEFKDQCIIGLLNIFEHISIAAHAFNV